MLDFLGQVPLRKRFNRPHGLLCPGNWLLYLYGGVRSSNYLSKEQESETNLIDRRL
jgi:hypothetical protein